MKNLEGVFVVLVTPFTASGAVDHSGLEKNVDWLVGEGVHGVIPLGSTGEFASIEDDDKAKVIDTVVRAAAGRIPVVVGAAAETTEKALANARQAERAGAAGILLLSPWYYSPDQEEIYHHFRRVAEGIGIPLMIYNNPSSSKVDVTAATVARLAKLPNVRCIKESTGDIKRITEIRMATEDGITVFCGWEDMAYESFVMGARGWVCVIGNILPRAAVQLYDLVVVKKDLAAGWHLYRRLLPLLRMLEYAGKTQKILKHALDGMGRAGGASRSPKLPLGKEDGLLVDALVREFLQG
jgi:4-hydroxy-tetrahydrodipicolinate synthase